MSKNSNTKKHMIFLLAVVLILLAGQIFGYLSILGSAYDAQAKKQSLKNERARVATLSDVKTEIETIEGAADIFSAAYIDGDNVVGFIQLVESLGAQSAVEVQIQKVDVREGDINEPAGVQYGYIEMVLQARGSWQAVTKFLLLIENLPYHASIDAMKLNSTQNEGGVVWSLSFSLTGITNQYE